MPAFGLGESSGRKQHQSLLGNVFGKLGSSKKKTPARRTQRDTDDLNENQAETTNPKRTLFSPFSPSRLPKSTQKTGKAERTASRISPVRLFGRGGATGERGADGLIAARHAGASSAASSAAGDASSIRVVVRVRPKSDRERAVGVSVQEGAGRGENSTDTLNIRSPSGESLAFGFDRVLGAEKDQRDVYDASGSGVVENCLRGFNGCLLAYGQTGSGKTYSMMGGEDGSNASRGIIQRSFEELFAKIEGKKAGHASYETSVSCSFVEIYNETVSDLTNPAAGNLQIRDDRADRADRADRSSGVFVDGVQWHQVRSVGDVQQVLAVGMANRRVAETMANDRSSRSHSVFTATIEQRMGDENGVVLRSRLHLVDLAGSERQKASGAAGERLKEASNINKSLSALGHVIMTLVDVQQGKKRHVPYRDSKLTFLLQDALGGTAKTVLLATVSPAASNSFETLSTLRFADNVKRIKNKAVVNEDASGDAASLRKEVVRLRQLLATANAVGPNRDGEDYGDANDDNDDDNEGRNERNDGDHASQKALVAALTREERACRHVASLQEELAALQGLVDAKEADLQRTKMMLRLKESRITSVSSATGASRDEERARLEGEIALLKQKIDMHPDVKKFALENIRLRRQLDLVAEGEPVAPSTGATAGVSAEEFGELRSQLLTMTSRAETLMNEVQMLRAEATASRAVLRTAEKRRRGSVDDGFHGYNSGHNHGEEAPRRELEALQLQLDEARLVAETQAAKVAEYDRMCAHAGALDSTVETLTATCERLGADRDEWYGAYTDALQEIVAMWSTQGAMQSGLDAVEQELATARVTHAAANEHAKRRISEAMKAAAQLNDEIQRHQERIMHLEQELNVARTDADDARVEAKDLERRLHAKDAELSEVHALASRHGEQIETHVGTIDDLGKQLEALQTAHQSSTAEATAVAKELKSTQAALASAQIDAQMTAAQLKEKTRQLNVSEESESELRATIISLQDELSDLRADAQEKKSRLDELCDELAASEATARETLADQSATIDTLKKEKAALHTRVKTLEAQLKDDPGKKENVNPGGAAVAAVAAGPMGQEAQARNYHNITQKLADAEEKMSALREETHALKAQVKSRDDAIAKLRNQMAMEVNDAAQQVQELLAAQARADRLERQLSALLTSD